MLSGCGMQAKIIQSRHWELNDTIRQTKNEQFLLNMVRMRYIAVYEHKRSDTLPRNFPQ